MDTIKTCPNCGSPSTNGACARCASAASTLPKSEFVEMPTGPTPPPARDAAPDPLFNPGDLFGPYEIAGLLGKGGMGVVYKARQPSLDRIVALKILPPRTASDPDFQERFRREARALAALSHPNIVAVYDFGAHAGLFYFAMEYIDGVSLRQLIRERRLTAEQALAIVPQLCDALQYAHGEGVVHRDVKPENILLDRKGRVKIADFGLAKLTGADVPLQLTQTNMVMGTPHYMAPEQLENPRAVDHRADIYSMGVVFYEMLTSELPIGRFEAPSRRAPVDARLDEVVLKALAKEPAQRYQRASEVKDDVTKLTVPVAYAPTVVSTAQRPPSRAPLIVGACVALAAIALVAFLIFRPGGKPPDNPTVTPPREETLSVDRIFFRNDETPARHRWLVPDPAKDPFAPRNPYLARAPEELDRFVQSMNWFGLPNVSRAELKEGYLAAWWGISIVSFVSPVAERVEKALSESESSGHRWIFRHGEFFAVVWAGRDSRIAYEDLVRMTRAKLGLPAEEPPLPLRLARPEKGDLPSDWEFADEWPSVAKRLPVDGAGDDAKQAVIARLRPLHELQAGDIREVYWGGVEKSRGKPAIEAVVVEFASRPPADALAAKLAAAKFGVKSETLRTGATVAFLALHTDDFGPFEKLASQVRPWFGRRERTFDTIRPLEIELPLGLKFASAPETDPRKVADTLDAESLRGSEIERAFYVTIDQGGMIALVEMKEQSKAYEVANELRRLGPSWSYSDFICVVSGSEPRIADALEDRMREKFGWDAKTR